MTSEPRPPDATLLQHGFDPAAATPRVDGTLRDTGAGPASNLSTLPYIAVGPAGGSEFPAIPGYEIVEELGRGGMGGARTRQKLANIGRENKNTRE